MKRDYTEETRRRVAWVKDILAAAGANAIVFGNSGGKDAALTGILCRMACEDTMGLIMPCESRRNFEADTQDALLLAAHFDIAHMTVDLTAAKAALINALNTPLSAAANTNIAPRLRMTALYAAAQARGALVAGTGNKSEYHMGYFTKWGDGGCDFNPIGDLTVTEVYEFLRHLNAPSVFYTKAPSAGLYDGQTDEEEMGITYKEIDAYLLDGIKGPNFAKIERAHRATAHKRHTIRRYPQ